MPEGIERYSGTYNATIHNCVIDDDVYINQIKNYIANYHIGKKVLIENVGTLTVDGSSGFGNGVRIAVPKETGGREMLVYNKLSINAVRLIAFYHHKPGVINKLTCMIDEYTVGIRSDMDRIKERAHPLNCHTLLNVYIGRYAKIEGIYRLNNGSISSSEKDPAYISPGVIAKNFDGDLKSMLM